MNSSSIVMAFVIAGVVSVVVHNITIGPIILGSENVVNKTEGVLVKKVEKQL